MTNGVALAGMGPDLSRPAPSAGRLGPSRQGSGRDEFAALVSGLRELTAPAPDGPEQTPKAGPIGPDQDLGRAEDHGHDEDSIDPLPAMPQPGPMAERPHEPREATAESTDTDLAVEAGLAEANLIPSERTALEMVDATPGFAAGLQVGPTGLGQPGVVLNGETDSLAARGELTQALALKAEPWSFHSGRTVDVVHRGPTGTGDPLPDAADAPMSGPSTHMEGRRLGAAIAPEAGLMPTGSSRLPGGGLDPRAAPGVLAASAFDRLREAGTAELVRTAASPADRAPEPRRSSAVSAAAEITPAALRPANLRTPGGKSVAKQAAAETSVTETSGDQASKAQAPASRPVVSSVVAASHRWKATGAGVAPGPEPHARDIGRPVGPRDQTPKASGFAIGPTGEGAPGSASALATLPEAQRIARQVATLPVLRTGGSTEVNLAPEELGHLRLSVEIGEGGLRIVIEAARPETCDLMRRHVEALRQELRQEGLGAVSVSIGGGESRQGGNDPQAAGRTTPGQPPGPGRPRSSLLAILSPPAPPCPGRSAPLATSICVFRRLP